MTGMLIPAILDDEHDTDPFRPSGPYGIAKACGERIEKLQAQLDGGAAGRRSITREIRQLRRVVQFCRTRAGYVEPKGNA